MLRLRCLLSVAVISVVLALVACSSDDPMESAAQQAAAQAVQEDAQPQPAAAPADQPESATEQEQPGDAQDSRSEQTAAQSQQEQDAQPQPSAEGDTDEEEAAEPVHQQQQAQDAQAQEAVAQTQEAQQAAEVSEVAQALAGIPGIVDPDNLGWPREVEGSNGTFSIPAKPLRIITASIGHDEIVLALVPSDRLVAVGAVSKDATFSNISELVADKPEISRDPETIIVQTPDIVVTSPWFAAEGVDALQRAGILVIQTDLDLDPETHINNIMLIGYIIGEEERALAFTEEVRARYQTVLDATNDKVDRRSVLTLTKYGDSLWTAGSNSTQGSLIAAAGGINAAAEAGIDGNQTVSLESVIAMAPEVIIIPQPLAYGAEEFRQSLFDNEALAEVPAILNDAVYIVESKHFTTLSHWNIRGAEDLARILWPEDFPDPVNPAFSLAE